MDLGLQDKIAIVTGGSRGLGRSIAFSLVREGTRVAICARDAATLEATAAELRAVGGKVLAIPADMTARESPEAIINQTVSHFGGLDILVNNVGGGGGPSFASTEDDGWQSAIDLTLWPTIRCSRLAIRHMAARGGGAILMITSIWGRELGGRPAYVTVKAAEGALAKAMARELAPQGIRVNALAPGSIIFPGGAWQRQVDANPDAMKEFVRLQLPAGRFGKPEEIGDVAAFLCSPRASWVTGVSINVDGGQSHSIL